MTRTTTNISLLAQADLLLLTADLLNHPSRLDPGNLTVDAADLRRLLELAGFSAGAPLGDAILNALREARSVDPLAWSAEHARLFDAATLCPANESAFIRRDKGAILADLAGFYAAFGFTREPASGEKGDHLRAELHFAAMLLVMLHSAQQQQDDAAEIVRAALADFHADHLGLWIAAFCDQLQAITVLPLYDHVADALRLAWQAVAYKHQLPATDGGEHEPTSYEPPAGTPYECGIAENAGPAAPRAVPVPLNVSRVPGAGKPAERLRPAARSPRVAARR